MTRRLFITGGIFSGMGALYLILRGIFSFLQQPASRTRPTRFTLLGLRELTQSQTDLLFRRGVWLIRDDRGWYGLVNVCTHLGCQPAFDPKMRILICPCHGSRFDLQGNVLKGPAARPLQRPFLFLESKQEVSVDLRRLVDSGFRLRT
jgi:nitrite reductase/ring-hydroxylating ferredoxin subunit